MKLGSLFDGIGGWPLAALRHGIIPVWSSEIEPFPISVTKRHFPDMKHLGDLTKINGAEIEPVDIITFGSPCQDLSVAGKRAGMAGKRSGLFMEAVRIIREMRDSTDGKYPRFAVWENVPGAFSSNKGDDFRAVLEEIAEAKIPMPKSGKWATSGMVGGNGVEIAWRVLDAQYWGVPQRRKRIFLVADFGGCRAGEILFKPEGLRGNIAESEGEREGTAGSVAVGIGNAIGFKANSSIADNAPVLDECIPPLQVTSQMAVLPFDTTQITSPQNGNKPKYGDPCHPLCATAHVPAVVRKTAYSIQGSMIGRELKNGPQGSGVNEDVCFTLNTTDCHAVAYGIRTAQTGSNGWGITEETAYTLDLASGQAVACTDKPFLASGKPAVGCLMANCGTKLWLGNQEAFTGDYHIINQYRVRRLTPTECERLQGLPDGYTAGGSDTQRYKALGNGMAQPCADYVIEGIANILLADGK